MDTYKLGRLLPGFAFYMSVFAMSASSCGASPLERMVTTATTNNPAQPNTLVPLTSPISPLPLTANIAALVKEGGTATTITLSDLPVEQVQVSIFQVNTDGSLTYLTGQLSSKNENYLVYVDYDKHATVVVPGATSLVSSTIYDVGVAIRVEANLTAKADNVNLGSLFGLGAAVDNSKVVGTIQMTVIGLQNPAITDAIPIPSSISDSSITAVIAAIGTIKSKIYDQPDPTTHAGGTTVVPLVIGESVAAQYAKGQIKVK